MERITYSKIRSRFKDFYGKRGYQLHKPSLINCYDGDTLFTIAGMKQFSSLYTSLESKPQPQLTIQPCIRVNDLENIGKSPIHSSFFEMMGVFSFTAVDKSFVIQNMYDFFTSIGMEKKYLIATTHSNDDVAYDIWCSLLGQEKVIKLETNFWAMGEYGICGPCTEVYYNCNLIQDKTEVQKKIEAGDTTIIEIGNSVFMNYNKTPQGMEKTKEICLDMGLGLTRVCAVLNGTFDIYKTDIEEIHKLLSFNPIVTDSVITAFWIMKEGIKPGNSGREYVLRKLLRRAFFIEKSIPVKSILEIMTRIYEDEDFEKQAIFITEQVVQEQDLFSRILQKSKKLLECSRTAEEFGILYHTHGVPLELIEQYASPSIMKEVYVEAQKHKEKSKQFDFNSLSYNIPTKAIFYQNTECISKIVFIENIGDRTLIATEESCFYPQGGGQVGDKGTINSIPVHNTVAKAITFDEKVILHECERCDLKVGDTVYMKVDTSYRQANTRAHTALHLVGEYIMCKLNCKQQGSYVCDDEARIDVTATKKSVEDIIGLAIDQANEAVKKQIDTQISYMPISETQDCLQDEGGYGKVVRVVKIPNFSSQLCGGTHVSNTKEIGVITLIKVENKGQGITRIRIACGLKSKLVF